ncbi:MAG TPA: NEW3 domain-containing protein, partial [Bacillota bacterium]|nr:NEW3 domain-containing protein [Bacillota bacterium]
MLRKSFIATFGLLFSLLTIFMSPTFAQSLTLYTPYSGLSVTPGESITYDVDVINDEQSIEHVTFDLEKLPKEWDYSIRAGGYSIDQLSIMPQSDETIKVEVIVPLEVKKGAYSFNLVATNDAGGKSTLPLLVNVSEEGTFQTEFSIEQPNMQGHNDSTLTYAAELKNQTADEQHYSLAGQFPEGWEGIFKVDGSNVTSVTIEPNESKNITIEVTPAENVKADLYKIPLTASTGSTSAEIEIEADILGQYDIQITTPEGNVSSDLIAGRNKTVKL